MSDAISQKQDLPNWCQGFAPILPPNPKLMILGTMPSVKSLEDAFYYAHPRNAFWPIMAEVFQQPCDTIDEKTALMQQHNILLWDVLQSCQRAGSLDSAIQNPQANRFDELFQSYPDLQHVLFNGQAAQKLFQKEVLRHQTLPNHLQFYALPSTSPANARLTFENKRFLWQETLAKIV